MPLGYNASPETSYHSRNTSPDASSLKYQPPFSRHNLGSLLHGILLFSPQIQFDSHLSLVLRPHPASCSPRHQIHYDRCSSAPPLDENSATQRRSPNTTSQHSRVCPLSHLRHHTLLRGLVPASPSAPLFCLSTASSYRPITFSMFTTCLKRLISKIGLDPANYSPHSFRRSSATFAFQSGVQEHLIKVHSDWRSNAFCAYLALPLTSRTQVADIMAAGLGPSKQ